MRLSDGGEREQESVLYFSCGNTTQWRGCSEICDTALPVLTVPHLHSIPICCINRHYSHISLSHSCGTRQLKMWAAKLCRAHKWVFPPLLHRQQLSDFGKERITAECIRSWDRQQLGQQFSIWCENFQISRTT